MGRANYPNRIVLGAVRNTPGRFAVAGPCRECILVVPGQMTFADAERLVKGRALARPSERSERFERIVRLPLR
ncbi:hypothetical protein D9M71_677150 [compost metagenome]